MYLKLSSHVFASHYDQRLNDFAYFVDQQQFDESQYYNHIEELGLTEDYNQAIDRGLDTAIGRYNAQQAEE